MARLATLLAVAANLALFASAFLLRPRFASDGVVRVLLVLFAVVNLLALASPAHRWLWEVGIRVRRIAVVTNAGLALAGLAFAVVSFERARGVDSALPFLLPVPAVLNLAALRATHTRET